MSAGKLLIVECIWKYGMTEKLEKSSSVRPSRYFGTFYNIIFLYNVIPNKASAAMVALELMNQYSLYEYIMHILVWLIGCFCCCMPPNPFFSFSNFVHETSFL